LKLKATVAEQHRPRNAPHAPSKPSSVLTELRSLIADGRYKPGDKLPPERVIAAKLKVGRPAIREAIKALSILDVLESRRGDGTYVKSLTAVRTGWPAVVDVPENFNLLELLEVRKMLEPKAAGLAAARGSVHELREIERLRSSLESDSIGWQMVADLDFRLHEAIVRASGNSILNEVHRFLSPMLAKSREITARSSPAWTRMRQDHAAIVEAIVRGEANGAEHTMLEHMHHIGLDLISDRKR
jgi:GntR family transcriptional regulator, transcriptional repressor for pyruvate dehydrogenase complex